MLRKHAVFIGDVIAKECLPIIDQALSPRVDSQKCRVFLREVRDRIHQGLLHFNAGNAWDEHEDIYLLLFDALALVSNALWGPLVNVEDLARAREVLLTLKQDPVTV